MATSPQPPPTDLGILVLLAYQGFVHELHAAMAAEGFGDLGTSDGVVFRILNAGPCRSTDLAVKLNMSKQGAAQIVDDIAARGYVVRCPDPGDARARLLELSERGRAALAAARRFHATYEKRLTATHGADALVSLRELLLAMARSAPPGLDRALRGLYL